MKERQNLSSQSQSVKSDRVKMYMITVVRQSSNYPKGAGRVRGRGREKWEGKTGRGKICVRATPRREEGDKGGGGIGKGAGRGGERHTSQCLWPF